MRVAIIGGGINGYCCAVQILESLRTLVDDKNEVTVISDEFSPNTTGDGSAGLWGPYCLGQTSQEKINKWSKGMHRFLEKVWLSEDAGEAGVCLIPAIRVTTSDQPMADFWKNTVYGFRPLSQAQLNEYNENRTKKYINGVQYVTYTSEPLKLLPYLMKRFLANGGKSIQMKVENLEKFIENSQYDVYINCTGLGSRDLINDKTMYPVRGQVARVVAPWMYYVFLDSDSDGNYIIPNTEAVVLGGVQQKDNYSKEISVSDKKFIIEGCRKLVPALKNATHLFDWAGLRPGRDYLRLEVEKNGNKIIIHNYGHGGSGVTLSWGCGEEVLDLLKKETYQKQKKFVSKL